MYGQVILWKISKDIPLEFRTKYTAHAFKDIYLIKISYFKKFKIWELVSIFETASDVSVQVHCLKIIIFMVLWQSKRNMTKWLRD